MHRRWVNIFDRLLGSLFPIPSHLGKKSMCYGDPKVALFEQEHGFLSSCSPLVGRVTKNDQDLNKVSYFLEKISSECAAFEILAKVVSYRDLRQGMEIPFLGSFLWVDILFQLGGGLPAFGLIDRQKGYSILLFRGTDLGLLSSKQSLLSFIADCDPHSVGWSAFYRGRSMLYSWLKKSPNPCAVGFSLGGILASYVVLYGKRWIKSPSFAFNPPGAYQHLYAKRFQHIPQKGLITYVTHGDWVCKVGKPLGEVVRLHSLHVLGPISAHTRLITGDDYHILT